jgi:hypothetical protein
MTTEIPTAEPPESKRIKQLRLTIAKDIPKFPNNKETLAILEAKSLGSLLIDYINWVYRLVPPRRRSVTIESTLTADPRWKALSADTKAFLEKVKRGDDLTPHLSLRTLRYGFTPASSSTSPLTDKWEDKDFVLNTMGYHHFHLSQIVETAGHNKRTDVVLFAQVTKNKFCAIGLFDHSVFEPTEQTTRVISTERERLWKVFDERNSAGRESGSVYISSPIATSGHSIQHTSLAIEFARVICLVDQKLDDLSSRSEVFKDVPHDVVKAMKLRWALDYLNLGLLDKTTSTFYVLRYGQA